MQSTAVSERRLAIARYHSDDDKTSSLIKDAREGKLGWQNVAEMFACNLQAIDRCLCGQSVYDYDKQEWLDAEGETQ